MTTGESTPGRRMMSRRIRTVGGSYLGVFAGAMAVAGIVAPSASAAPDCSKQAVSATADSVTTAAQEYLANHPDANRVLVAAALQPHDQAEASVRSYAAAHPQETAEFKQILLPLYQTQQACNVSVLPANISWAFNEFMSS